MTKSKKQLISWGTVSAVILVALATVSLGIFPKCSDIVTKIEMKEAIAKESQLLKKDCEATGIEVRHLRDDIKDLRVDVKEILRKVK